MAVKRIVTPERFVGLSTDSKPTDGATSVRPGATFLEYDTNVLYITHDGTNWVVKSASIDKTIETELKIIAAVSADAQDTSSTLSLANMKKIAIFIDHGRDATGAFVGAGTEYRVEVSEQSSGDDTWRPIASATAAITAALGHAMDDTEPVGETTINIGATSPVLGDIQFFKNGTIANSEWARIIDETASTSFTIQDGLTNEQAAITSYSQGEHFSMLLDVSAYTRLRVVCNNNNGSTNQNIVWRCAAIDQT